MGLVLENDVWILKNDSSWTVEYEVDFAAEGAASEWTVSGDAQQRTLNGVQWTCNGTANSSTRGVNSSGMHITPTGGNLATSTVTATRFVCYLDKNTSPLYPNASYQQVFAFQAIIQSSTDVSADTDAYGIILLDDVNSQHIQARRMYNAGAYGAADKGYSTYAYWTAGSATAHTTDGTQMTQFELVLLNGSVYGSVTGTGTTFVDPMTTDDWRETTNTQTVRGISPSAFVLDKDELAFMFWAFRADTSTTAFTPTMVKFRLLSMGKE